MSKTPGWIVLSIGILILLGAGIWFAVRTSKKQHATGPTIWLGLGAALTIVGIILLLILKPAPKKVATS